MRGDDRIECAAEASGQRGPVHQTDAERRKCRRPRLHARLGEVAGIRGECLASACGSPVKMQNLLHSLADPARRLEAVDGRSALARASIAEGDVARNFSKCNPMPRRAKYAMERLRFIGRPRECLGRDGRPILFPDRSNGAACGHIHLGRRARYFLQLSASCPLPAFRRVPARRLRVRRSFYFAPTSLPGADPERASAHVNAS